MTREGADSAENRGEIMLKQSSTKMRVAHQGPASL